MKCQGALLPAFLAALASCAPAVSIDNPSPFEEDDPAAFTDGAERQKRERGPAMAIAQPDPCRRNRKRARRRRLVVARTEVMRVLDAGPGVILRGLEVKPSFVGRRFAGWEIVQFMPCATSFDGLDLRPGDVVGRINRQEVARPEHLANVWTQLRTAPVITIEVRRSAGDFELRFEVSEDAKPAGP